MNPTSPIIPPPVIDPYRTEPQSYAQAFGGLLWLNIMVARAVAMIWFLLLATQANNWGGILYNLAIAFLLFPAWGWTLMGHGKDDHK
jgi:hypothetical protein